MNPWNAKQILILIFNHNKVDIKKVFQQLNPFIQFKFELIDLVEIFLRLVVFVCIARTYDPV